MQVTLNLPDEIAQRARDAGLLTVDAVQSLLEEALRRAAGRNLLSMAERLHAANIAPLDETQVDDLIQATRADRKARNAGGA